MPCVLHWCRSSPDPDVRQGKQTNAVGQETESSRAAESPDGVWTIGPPSYYPELLAAVEDEAHPSRRAAAGRDLPFLVRSRLCEGSRLVGRHRRGCLGCELAH
jgi:hypothetical protein